MKALIKLYFLQLLRSKVIWLIFALFFLVEWAGVHSMRSITVRYQGMFASVGTGDILLASLYLAIFPTFLVSMVYGVWTIPYHHAGARAPITFVLPVDRWKYPVAHFLVLLAIFLIQLLFCFGITWHAFPTLLADLPTMWKGFLSSSTVLFLSFFFSTVFLAVFAILWGQMLSVLFFSIVLFLLQVGAAASRYDQTLVDVGFLKILGKAYPVLPPLGELLFDLRLFFTQPSLWKAKVGLWVIWTILIAVVFTLQIGRFRPARSA